MEALEFTAVLQNGLVQIPVEHRPRWEGKAIRVIVLEDLGTSTSSPKIQERNFTAVALKTKDFRFSRDEANER